MERFTLSTLDTSSTHSSLILSVQKSTSLRLVDATQCNDSPHRHTYHFSTQEVQNLDLAFEYWYLSAVRNFPFLKNLKQQKMEKYLPLSTDDENDHSSDPSLSSSSTNDLSPLSNLPPKRPWINRATAFHIILITLNILSALIYTKWIASKYIHGPQNIHFAARQIISYEGRAFENSLPYLANGSLNPLKKTHFTGPPRPELAEAWRNLTQHQNIIIPSSSLGQFSNSKKTLVKLTDGSGYASTLAVFHGLHCVERLHHFVHREFYYEGIGEEEGRLLKFHTEHCIDWLRQHPKPVAHDEGKHQCVKWEPIEKWMAERTFDAFEPGLLVHPIFGNPYGEDRMGDKIGIVVDEREEHNRAQERKMGRNRLTATIATPNHQKQKRQQKKTPLNRPPANNNHPPRHLGIAIPHQSTLYSLLPL
ncbi:hypothetical protein G7Y89_g10769 [Cudoniella acicularis]|uniref:Uncharacterized protein n=1 Tax=Cudoniella acicularis TaxID=354080 RepID=A0A8H4RFR9_9HELO|nr:hypothetical protein G7Y89_g10769 [Cudoniella acicularis]